MKKNKITYNAIIFFVLKSFNLFLAISTGPIFYWCKSLLSSFYTLEYYEMFSVFLLFFSISIAISNSITLNISVKRYGLLTSTIICLAIYVILSGNFHVLEIWGLRVPLISSKFTFVAVFGFDVIEFIKTFQGRRGDTESRLMSSR